MHVDDGGNTIRTVNICGGGVRLAGTVTEQKHLLAIKGVFRPGDVRQRAGGAGTRRVVGILMVDEVDWCGPSSATGRKRREGAHTESVRANVVASQTVHLREFTAVDGTNEEEVLPTFPY